MPADKDEVVIRIWRQDHDLLPWAYTFKEEATGGGGGNSATTLAEALNEASERVKSAYSRARLRA